MSDGELLTRRRGRARRRAGRITFGLDRAMGAARLSRRRGLAVDAVCYRQVWLYRPDLRACQNVASTVEFGRLSGRRVPAHDTNAVNANAATDLIRGGFESAQAL